MLKRISLFIVLLGLFLIIMITNAYYRWDQKVISPMGYKIGVEMSWYEEQETSLEELKVQTIFELERKLERQGFTPRREGDAYLFNGYHRKADGLYWYKFKVSENTVVYEKEFLTAWGLCSQSAGLAINPNNKDTVRLLNPGGTCV